MQNKMTARRLLAAICVFAVFGASQAISFAANPNKGAKQALSAAIKAAPKYHGKVVSVDTTKGTITIQEKKAAPMTFTVNSTTRIKLDKAKSSLADLTPGLKVTVRSTDKTTALEITAHDKNEPAATTPAPAPTPAG